MERKSKGGVELVGLDKEKSLSFMDSVIIRQAKEEFDQLMAKAESARGKRKDRFLKGASILLKKYPELLQSSTPDD